jgi:hypothetical protein
MFRRTPGRKKTWTWSVPVRGLALGLVLLAQFACGDSGQMAGKPSVGIHPVDPITFVFHNATANPIFVDWSAGKAPLRVLRDEVDLRIDPGCAPLCKDACACLACPTPEHKVLRIGPDEELKVVWDATHFLLHPCEEAASCSCAESWPATAGKYRTRLAASTAVTGGTPDPTDPRVLNGAQIDPTAATCGATAVFQLVGTTQLSLPFECQ